MADVSKLLFSRTADPSFLSALEPTNAERTKLLTSRALVRGSLRTAFARADKELGASVSPRFFTQGSWAYRTLNRAPFMPPQQMDLDDGVYLPLSFLREAPKPSLAADVYFKVVDTALDRLAQEQRWKFEQKDTCARLIVSDVSHIDVPMYAIPDVEFVFLEEKATATLRHLTEDEQELEFMSARDDSWRNLPSDKIMLAHRKENWVQSDPRKIHTWFVGEVDQFGEQFRRVCRYLKAWRDQHNALDQVSSVSLMACVSTMYRRVDRGLLPTREDEALAYVAHGLADLFATGVENPTNREERLDRQIDDNMRPAVIAKCRELSTRLSDTLKHCMNARVAVDTMRSLLGGRVPDREDLVVIKLPAEAVREQPKALTPIPAVGRSRSG